MGIPQLNINAIRDFLFQTISSNIHIGYSQCLYERAKMKAFFVACFSTCFLSAVSVPVSDDPNLIKDESKGVEFLDWYNAEFSKVEYRYRLTQWDYYTNITDHNQKKVVSLNICQSDFFIFHNVFQSHLFSWKKVLKLYQIILCILV